MFPYIWIVGIPITLWAMLKGVLLLASVKLPNYPAHPRLRMRLLLLWLTITGLELVVEIFLIIGIFSVAILVGKLYAWNVRILTYFSDYYLKIDYLICILVILMFLGEWSFGVLFFIVGIGFVAFVSYIWHVVYILY